MYQLIENDAIQTVDFTSSRLRSNNMVNDQLQVRYDSLGDIVINGMARLLMWDMELRNGVVHLTDAFMLPDTATIDQKFEAEGLKERFSIFNQALKETGIARLMHKTEDQTEYSYYSVKTGAKVIIPRYYKFTIFAESDSTYARLAGIHSLDDLKQWCDNKAYGDPSLPIDDPQSSLYRYIAYHCLDRVYYKKISKTTPGATASETVTKSLKPCIPTPCSSIVKPKAELFSIPKPATTPSSKHRHLSDNRKHSSGHQSR